MIAYLDASALVKRYVEERQSTDTAAFIAAADVVTTSIVTRAEVAAALAKAVRLKLLRKGDGDNARRLFASHWLNLARMDVTDTLVVRAEQLAWSYSLRGYDAIHLASAVTYQELGGMPVTLATFDRQLWEAARKAGVVVWPDALSG